LIDMPAHECHNSNATTEIYLINFDLNRLPDAY
jgi:hypothetical protein